MEQKRGVDENIDRVADVSKVDRRCSYRLIEQKTGIPKTIIQRILREDLKKRKVSARFVPHALRSRKGTAPRSR